MKKKELPPLPAEIYLPAGSARIVRQRGLQKTEKAVGKFNWATRLITLDAELEGSAAWLTLFHERIHIVLLDAGIDLPHGLLERVCDAIAADRVAELIESRRR